MEKLEKLIQNFMDGASYLRIIRANISMESVRTDRSKKLFSTLAKEIQNLTENINKVASNMADDLEKAQAKQAVAQKEIGDGVVQIFGLHEMAEVSITDATNQARDMVNISSNWIQKVSDSFTAIAKNISDVIIALQLHDIFRQQLEHVIEANREIQNRISSNKKDKKVLAYAYKVSLLQAAQVNRVHDDVSVAYNNISKAFSNINSCLEQISEKSVDCDQDKSETSIFANLINKLNQFNEHISKADDLSSKTTETIDMVKTTTLALTGYIREIRKISRELSFKALNAIILTEKLGEEGKTLAVLTEEVYNNAGRSQNMGNEVTRLLSEITNISELLSEKGVNNELNESTRQLQKAISEMEHNFNDFSSSSEHTESEIERIESETNRIICYLDFIKDIVEKLNAEKNMYNEFLVELEPFAIHADSETHDEIESLQKSYTMEQERAIHNQAISGITASGNLKPETDDDNFELFDIEPKTQQKEETVAVAETKEDDFDDNIELF